jgi:maltose O-acetyltransferase
MKFLEKLTSHEYQIHKFDPSVKDHQAKASKLCFELSMTPPGDIESQLNIYQELFGSMAGFVSIKSHFRCDYGFNIHFKGFALINYHCVILDTSPVTIGAGAMIGPGSVLACVNHAIDPQQRNAEGLYDSAPITLEDNVWLGANVTVCGGVTIGEGSIIGAGSVVTRDIPPGVIAVGTPCKVVRQITEQDKWEFPPIN